MEVRASRHPLPHQWEAPHFPDCLRWVLERTPPNEPIVRIFKIAEKFITEENRMDQEGIKGPVRWGCSFDGDLYLEIDTNRDPEPPCVIRRQAFSYRPGGKTEVCGENTSPFKVYSGDWQRVERNLQTLFGVKRGGFVTGQFVYEESYYSLRQCW